MFVYYFVHVRGPLETMEQRLIGLLSRLDGMAAAAYREGEILRARIAAGGSSGPLLARKIRISVGEPLRGETETDIPISFEATGKPGLFPSMDADIIVAAVGPELTQLTLRGSYDPPLGAFGRALDRALLHRVAEACVKSLVDRIAYSLERQDYDLETPPARMRSLPAWSLIERRQ